MTSTPKSSPMNFLPPFHLFLAAQVTNYCQVNLRNSASVKHRLFCMVPVFRHYLKYSLYVRTSRFLKTWKLTLHMKAKFFVPRFP